MKIKDLLDSDRIHKTKETLVLTYGVVGNGSVQTIPTLPSCSKTESDQFSCMIDARCKTLNPDIIATDGDAMRRKLFNGRNKIILDRDVKTELKKLPLFHLHIIDGKYALYYDDKHNAKRLRGVIISDKRGCMLGKNIISKSQLEYLFNASDIQNYEEILNSNDLQNVPAVLRLVDKLKTCTNNIESSRDQVCEESMESIKILIHIFDGILCVFSSPTICLIEQLHTLSILSHILYHQYRHHGTKFIPG